MSQGTEIVSDTVLQVNQDVLDYMEKKMNEPPSRLRSSVGWSSCCIYRVPRNLREIDKTAYLPEVVSIGPYHHGEEHLQALEEHKWLYLKSLLLRTKQGGIGLSDCLKAVMVFEHKARACYSETINLDRDKFIQMLVLDGCFIIEFLLKLCGKVSADRGDPILLLCISTIIRRDLLLLENQIPFFVLESLFELTKWPEEDDSLATLVLNNLNLMPWRGNVHQDCRGLNGKHILDLIRASSLPPSCTQVAEKENGSANVIPNATKLQLAGIKFKPGEADSLMDIKFTNGILEIPKIDMHDDLKSIFRNCIAFEQYNRDVAHFHFTTYVLFMDCLIDTPGDVGVLRDHKIIENLMGSDEEIAHFFNELGRETVWQPQLSYLSGQFEQVNAYYSDNWHVRWATLVNTYFNTTWSGIATIAASILLLLALTQTFFAVLTYFRPRN